VQKTETGHVVRALTIAGSDSGGGAGIQADLKTFSAFEVYGLSVITALTAQNTRGVHAVAMQSTDFVAAQLHAVFDDIGVDALKTGMLGTAEMIDTVANRLRQLQVTNLVVDPVMVAKGGASLLQADATEAMRQTLLPLAAVVTPNIPEAEVLCGYAITSWAACRQAVRDIASLGAAAVVIKGGHAQADWPADDLLNDVAGHDYATDLLFANGQETYFVTPRINSRKTHGTGCTFSAAITACLAASDRPVAAVARAKAYIYQAIAAAADWDVGHGYGPTDHSVQAPAAVPADIRAGYVYTWEQGAWARTIEVAL